MKLTSAQVCDSFVKNNPQASSIQIANYLRDYYQNSEFVRVYVECFDCGKEHGIGTFQLDMRRADVDTRVFGYLDYKCPRGHEMLEEAFGGFVPLDEVGVPFSLKYYVELLSAFQHPLFDHQKVLMQQGWKAGNENKA
jgi:hypothetical protein